MTARSALAKSINALPDRIRIRAAASPQHQKEMLHWAFHGEFPLGKVVHMESAIRRTDDKFERGYGLALMRSLIRTGAVQPCGGLNVRLTPKGFRRFVLGTKAKY